MPGFLDPHREISPSSCVRTANECTYFAHQPWLKLDWSQDGKHNRNIEFPSMVYSILLCIISSLARTKAFGLCQKHHQSVVIKPFHNQVKTIRANGITKQFLNKCEWWRRKLFCTHLKSILRWTFSRVFGGWVLLSEELTKPSLLLQFGWSGLQIASELKELSAPESIRVQTKERGGGESERERFPGTQFQLFN